MNRRTNKATLKAFVMILVTGLFTLSAVFIQSLVRAAPTWQESYGQNAEGLSDPSKQNSIKNLRAFAKLYGYVKYFHPSDEASAIDWERFAVYGSENVMHAESRDDLREKLTELFGPVAPTVQIYSIDDQPPAPHAVLTPEDVTGLDLVAWQHRGVGLGNPGPYQSIRLNRKSETSTGPGFGTIIQSINASPYRGMEVRLVASLRTEVNGSGNQAQLWLRIDRPNRQVGFFDNMQNRPVTTSDWESYQITGNVAEDAEYIVFGGFLSGKGRAWLDNFQLFVRDGDTADWSSVPLDNPAFEEGETGDPPVGWHAGAESYRFTTTDSDAYKGTQSLLIESQDRTEMAQPLFEARPGAGEVVERPLSRGLLAQIPLALYSSDSQTLKPENAPLLAQLEEELQYVSLNNLTDTDVTLRYANVLITWNIFQHFYPYFDVVDTDWDAVLTEALLKATNDSTQSDFIETLQWMVAQLEDGHGRVQHPSMREFAGLPFLVDAVENKIIIVAVADEVEENACFERGDLVISIDGILSQEVIRDSKKYNSGSSQWKTYLALRRFGRGQRSTEAILELERQGDIVECQVTRYQNGSIEEKRPAPVEMLREDIYYVDLSRASMNEINTELNKLATADGIIFDLRGYPNDNHSVLQHLSKDTLRSAHWQVPLQIYPDQTELVGYDTSGRWLLEPMEPYFKGKIVFLTDGRAISYAESIMGIVEHYHLGEIVGQPTAGANGNVNFFTLPGGYRISWTGMRVIKHDKSQHHLIGIKPTVPLDQTLEGVLADRDEYLESALELIEESLNP